MRFPRIRHFEKIVLGVCVAVFLGVAALSPLGFRRLDEIAARNPAPATEPVAYAASRAQVPAIGTLSWPEVPAQSRGRDWVYDVFTPPVIYYNRETGQFTVTPPATVEPTTPTDQPFDVELLAVRQEPYRVQLVGYVGTEGNYFATFELLETGDTVIGREGRSPARGEFTLRSFEVRRVTTTSTDSMPVVDAVAVAVIVDERTGREETLTNLERKMMPRLQAVLRLQTRPPEPRVVREGATIEVNGQRYLVAQLSLHPPSAVISRRASDALGAGETRTLSPVPSTSTERANSAIFSFPSD